MAAIRSLCTTTAYLNRGMLAQYGPTNDVVGRYLSDCQSQSAEAQKSFDQPRGATMWVNRVGIFCNGEPNAELPMGSSLMVEVGFNADPPIQSPRLGITVTHPDGYCLLNTNNRFQKAPQYPMPVHCGVIRCDFGLVPFTAGRYRLSVYLGNPVEDLQIIRDAIEILVTERDVGGTGMVPPSSISAMWWPTKFELDDPMLGERVNLPPGSNGSNAS